MVLKLHPSALGVDCYRPPFCFVPRLQSRARGAPVVFLLGYDPALKAAVSATLTSVGASILQPIPKNHWLVRSTPAGIRSVQEKFPTVTSVCSDFSLILCELVHGT